MLEPTPTTPTSLAGGPKKGLIDRAKDILLSPNTEWGVIDAEPSTISGIFTSYVLILAAIGPICIIIGQQVIGLNYGFVSFKPPIVYSVGYAVVAYVMTLVAVYVGALIIDALAPSFGGTKDPLKAFKVAAYAGTPGWLAGVFGILPSIAAIGGLVGLYGLYLLYLGLPRLMRVSEDKAIGYTVVVVIVQIVLYAVVFFVVGILVAALFGSMLLAAAGSLPTVRY